MIQARFSGRQSVRYTGEPCLSPAEAGSKKMGPTFPRLKPVGYGSQESAGGAPSRPGADLPASPGTENRSPDPKPTRLPQVPAYRWPGSELLPSPGTEMPVRDRGQTFWLLPEQKTEALTPSRL